MNSSHIPRIGAGVAILDVIAQLTAAPLEPDRSERSVTALSVVTRTFSDGPSKVRGTRPLISTSARCSC